MKTSQIKKSLLEYVDRADSDSLKFVQEAIIAYQAQKQKAGKKHGIKQPDPVAMTEDELFAMIDEAENNIKKGKVYSQAEVEEKVKARHSRV
jgi:hypothetical protein